VSFSPKQANRAASYIDGLHARCVGPLPGSIKRLIDALDVPLPNGPLDIRQRALAQADLIEPIGRAGEIFFAGRFFGSEVACKRCRLSAGAADRECLYYFFMVVVIIKYKITATAC
jgi:hypothetical protein